MINKKTISSILALAIFAFAVLFTSCDLLNKLGDDLGGETTFPMEVTILVKNGDSAAATMKIATPDGLTLTAGKLETRTNVPNGFSEDWRFTWNGSSQSDTSRTFTFSVGAFTHNITIDIDTLTPSSLPKYTYTKPGGTDTLTHTPGI